MSEENKGARVPLRNTFKQAALWGGAAAAGAVVCNMVGVDMNIFHVAWVAAITAGAKTYSHDEKAVRSGNSRPSEGPGW